MLFLVVVTNVKELHCDNKGLNEAKYLYIKNMCQLVNMILIEVRTSC